MKKYITILLLSLVVVCIFVGCSANNNSSNHLDSENSSSVETTETTTENTRAYVDENGGVQNSELAKSCQKIVGSGADKNGDIYEMVANVNESYEGSQLVVGVIKNSEWLIELTADCPYIKDEIWSAGGEDLKQMRCEYLSNGTFYELGEEYGGEETLNLWNVESNKTLYLNDIYIDQAMGGNTTLNGNDKLVLVQGTGSWANFDDITLKFLDTKTLETQDLYTVRDNAVDYKYHQISDGMFYVSIDFPNKKSIGTFYNDKGEKVFDLSEYDTEKTDVTFVGDFENGQCTIHNRLENGSEFKIIIDKQGNMISQEKL